MTDTPGYYKKGKKKRKKNERYGSSGSEVSPETRKKPKEDMANKTTSVKEKTMATKTVDVELMKQLKKETVSELKSFLRDEFDALEKKITREVKELEERFQSKVFSLEQKNIELEASLEQMNSENRQMKMEMECIKGQLQDVKNHAIANEQYSRKNNVKVFGIPEERGETCSEKVRSLVKEQLGINLTAEQVVVAHRVRSFTKPQPIIVRFSDHMTKITVLRSRKKLKGSKISIGEDMCRDLMTVYNRVKTDPRVSSAWMWDGKVFVKDNQGDIHTVWYGQTLDDILHCAVESRSQQVEVEMSEDKDDEEQDK